MTKKKAAAASGRARKPKPKARGSSASRRSGKDSEATKSREELAEELVASLTGADGPPASPLNFEDEPPSDPPSDSGKKKRGQDYDLLDLIDRKLRAKITVPGKGKRSRRKIAAHAVAERYVEYMVLGSFKYTNAYIDRKRGKPVQAIQVGGTAVDELRDWLTAPVEASAASPELEKALAIAKGLRSKKGRELRDVLLALAGGA